MGSAKGGRSAKAERVETSRPGEIRGLQDPSADGGSTSEEIATFERALADESDTRTSSPERGARPRARQGTSDHPTATGPRAIAARRARMRFTAGAAIGHPYTGLAAFQERDAARFFGRETMVEQVVARLVDQPLLALVGSSGAGKSSLVRAGIIPALKRGGDAWEAFVLRPGPRPLAALAELLLHHSWLRSSQSVDAVSEGRTDPLASLGENEAGAGWRTDLCPRRRVPLRDGSGRHAARARSAAVL